LTVRWLKKLAGALDVYTSYPHGDKTSNPLKFKELWRIIVKKQLDNEKEI